MVSKLQYRWAGEASRNTMSRTSQYLIASSSWILMPWVQLLKPINRDTSANKRDADSFASQLSGANP